MYIQKRFKSVWASSESDQSLSFLPQVTFDSWHRADVQADLSLQLEHMPTCIFWWIPAHEHFHRKSLITISFIHACAGSQQSWVTNFISVSSFTSIQNPCGQWKLGQDDSCKGVSNTPLLFHMTTNFHTNVKHICTCVTKAIIWLLQQAIIVSSSDTCWVQKSSAPGAGSKRAYTSG